jgi:hypothetical protein
MYQAENGSPPPLLQKWQRNDLFTAIQKAGLDPNDFALDHSGTLLRIKHRQSRSYLTISGHAGNYTVGRMVGDGLEMRTTAYSWVSVISSADTWAWQAKIDLETPDYWAELQHDTKLLGAVSGGITENQPFTPDEQKDIARRLQGLAEDIGKRFSLSGDQTKALGEKYRLPH